MLILTTTHLDITFVHSFSFVHFCLFYVRSYDLVFAWYLFMCGSGG